MIVDHVVSTPRHIARRPSRRHCHWHTRPVSSVHQFHRMVLSTTTTQQVRQGHVVCH